MTEQEGALVRNAMNQIDNVSQRGRNMIFVLERMVRDAQAILDADDEAAILNDGSEGDSIRKILGGMIANMKAVQNGVFDFIRLPQYDSLEDLLKEFPNDQHFPGM